jgi:Mg2+/Co2+ transporter CorB
MDGMIYLLIALIILSGFFSGVETAFVALSRLRLNHLLKRRKDKKAMLVKKLKDNPHKLISTLLIGNNIVNIAASAIATSIAIQMFGSNGIGIATGIMTLIVLIFGEITPKTIAMTHSEKICLLTARPIYFLSIIFTPLIVVLDLITRSITKFFRTKSGKRPIVTEEEIKSFVEIGEEIGSI